jgi:hypothetical protein
LEISSQLEWPADVREGSGMPIGGWRRLVMATGAGNPFHRSALLLACVGVLCGCTTAERTISRPTIAPGTDWKVEHCAGRFCPRVEDALVANDLRVRIETSVGTKSDIFRVTVDFFSKSNGFALDPSAVTVTLTSGKTLHATGLSCARKPSDLGGEGSAAPPPPGSRQAREVLCFHLIFASPPPAVTEEFVVRLDGVTRKGVTVRVPDIVFRPHVKSVPRSLFD